jgi:hypothetical protein
VIGGGIMKSKEFKMIVKPYLLENYLLLSLTSEWIEYFDGIPTFTVFVDKENKLHLVSEKVIRNE